MKLEEAGMSLEGEHTGCGRKLLFKRANCLREGRGEVFVAEERLRWREESHAEETARRKKRTADHTEASRELASGHKHGQKARRGVTTRPV